jgi:glucose/arabinose dehydrogenase
VVRENGDVVVVRRSGPSGEGGVVVLRDTTGDGMSDVRQSFGPMGGTGVALRGDRLLVDAKAVVLGYELPAGSFQPAGAPDTVAMDIPTGGHEAHSLALDGDGNLFLNIGSRTNSCQREDRQPRSRGVDPCAELRERAGIWRLRADGSAQRPTMAARYATGIRNAVAMRVDPRGQLWAAQMGRDQLLQNWPALYSEQESAEQPGEELLRVEQGQDYGWPYCYWDTGRSARVLAPEYGGDRERVGRCADRAKPVVTYPGHWAPIDMLFYTGRQFPAKYREGVFIAFHGSWNRAPRPQAGYDVRFQPLSGGLPSGEVETFAGGFAGERVQPGTASHRPIGLAQGPDGALYVSDDKGGRIWKIVYAGAGGP